jgi:hypothetical protein
MTLTTTGAGPRTQAIRRRALEVRAAAARLTISLGEEMRYAEAEALVAYVAGSPLPQGEREGDYAHRMRTATEAARVASEVLGTVGRDEHGTPVISVGTRVACSVKLSRAATAAGIEVE